MAENPILNSDFYNGNGKPFEEVITNILALEGHMDNLIKKISTLTSDIKTMASPTTSQQVKDQAKATKELEQAQLELAKAEKIRIQAQVELEKAAAQQIKLENQQTKNAQQQAGAYKKMSDELNTLRKRYKDLAAEENESTEEAKDLIKQIEKLDRKLKDIDGSVGQFTRNVGNYEGRFQKLKSAVVSGVGGFVNFEAALRLANSAIQASGVLSDKLAIGIEITKNSWNLFTQALVSWDWSGFMNKFNKIIDKSVKYAETLDDITEKSMAVDIQEKKTRLEIERLKESLQNVNLTNLERVAISKKITALEDKATEQRLELVKQEKKETLDLIATQVRATNQYVEKFFSELRTNKAYLESIEKIRAEFDKLNGRGFTFAEKMDIVKKKMGDSQVEIFRLNEELNNLSDEQKDRIRDVLGREVDLIIQNQQNKNSVMKRQNALLKKEEKEQAKEKKIILVDAEKEMMKAVNETDEQLTKEYNDRKEKELAERLKKEEQEYEDHQRRLNDKFKRFDDFRAQYGLESARELRDKQIEEAMKVADEMQASEKARKKVLKQINAEYYATINQQVQQYGALALDVIEAIGNFQDAQYNRDISAAGDNAKKKEEIEKKYAKKRQNLAVGQAIVNGALAVSAAAVNPWPMPALAMIAIAAAKAASEVAVIKSVKFAKGGSWIEGGRLHSEGGNNYGDKELERGERVSVFSRSATAHYGDTLEHLTKAVNDKRLDLFSLNFQPKPTVILNNDQRMLLAVAEKQLAEQRKTTSILSKSKTRIGNTTIDSNGNKTIHV